MPCGRSTRFAGERDCGWTSVMESAHDVITSAIATATEALAAPGDWLTGPQRRAAVDEVRDARTNELDQRRRDAISPNAVAEGHAATDLLPAEAVEVLHRISSDPGRLSQTWANEMIEALGEGTYTELVGIAATTAVVDMFSSANGKGDAAIGSAAEGDPARGVPDDVGDVGAWVSQSFETMANVSRSLSLVPVTNGPWTQLVQALYSRGPEFMNLEWDRGLSRPQVELVASRTTAELECFY